MEQRSAAYHRAAAARARRLRAEATTPWLKGHLENAIDEHEQIAEESKALPAPALTGTHWQPPLALPRNASTRDRR